MFFFVGVHSIGVLVGVHHLHQPWVFLLLLLPLFGQKIYLMFELQTELKLHFESLGIV